jgi:hypothetical protein
MELKFDTRFGVLAFSVFLAFAAQVRATVLPEACGADDVKFKVTTQKSLHGPDGPASDMAQIVIIEDPHSCCDAKIRIGVDGTWAGASKGGSYFAHPIFPGEHHLCMNWQIDFRDKGNLKDEVHISSLTAEAGKTYYYEVKIRRRNKIEHEPIAYDLELTPLNEDEGRYGVKTSKLGSATSYN